MRFGYVYLGAIGRTSCALVRRQCVRNTKSRNLLAAAMDFVPRRVTMRLNLSDGRTRGHRKNVVCIGTLLFHPCPKVRGNQSQNLARPRCFVVVRPNKHQEVDEGSVRRLQFNAVLIPRVSYPTCSTVHPRVQFYPLATLYRDNHAILRRPSCTIAVRHRQCHLYKVLPPV